MSSAAASCLAQAVRLVVTTELDAVMDFEEPVELCLLRDALATARQTMLKKLESSAPGGLFSLDDLYWSLSFAWADVQDYVEEANKKVINDAAGFRSEWLCVKKLADGTIVPDRPRHYFYQTLMDQNTWLGVDEDEDEDEPSFTSPRLTACVW
jgi:hypothetical protein